MLEMLLDGKNWFPVVPAILIVGGAFGVFAITTKMMLGIPGYGLAWLGSRCLWRGDMGASSGTMEA
jgi:hypothetical protein